MPVVLAGEAPEGSNAGGGDGEDSGHDGWEVGASVLADFPEDGGEEEPPHDDQGVADDGEEGVDLLLLDALLDEVDCGLLVLCEPEDLGRDVAIAAEAPA